VSVVGAGLARVAPAATACPLCAQKHEPKPAPSADRRDDALPWALALTAAVVVACVGAASTQSFGLGAVAGLLSGAALSRAAVRRAVQAKQVEHDCVVKTLHTEADDRVTMVIRQFEWAVNDVMKLRRDGERAQVTADLLVVQGRARERHIRKLERDLLETRQKLAVLAAAPHAGASDDADPAQIVFRFGLHHEGSITRLELECDGRVQRPTRVRLTDRDGTIVALSHTPMHSGDGALFFALVVPADFHEDLDPARTPVYRLEAQHEQGWRRARLDDTGRRTKIVADKKGRIYRLNDAAHDTTACARPNPFDADNAFFTL
jgi:hypothetical protein